MDTQTKAKLSLLLKAIYSKAAGSDFRLPVCHSYAELTPTYLESIKMPVDLCTLMVLVTEQCVCSTEALTEASEQRLATSTVVTPAKAAIMRAIAPLTKETVLLYIKQIYNNSLEFNKGIPVMEILARHLKYFSVSLFDELFRTEAMISCSGSTDKVAVGRKDYISNRLLRLLVTMTEVLDKYEVRLLLQLISLFPDAHKTPGYKQLLVALHGEVSRLNSSSPDTSFCRLSLLNLFKLMMPATEAGSETEAISKLLQLALPQTVENEKETVVATAANNARTNAQQQGLMETAFNTMTCHIYERRTRGCELSCIWATPQCMIYAQPPNKIGSNAWWPSMALVCIHLSHAHSAGSGSAGLDYAMEQRINILNHVNISRVPASTLSVLLKLVPRQGNYATATRKNNYYAAITALLDDIKRKDIFVEPPPELFQDELSKVGVEATGTFVSVTSGGDKSSRGAGTSTLVLVEYLNTHDFGWVKLDQCYPMCADSSFPMTLLPPAAQAVSAATTPSKDNKDLGVIRMGSGEKGVVEAKEMCHWLEKHNPTLFSDPTQYRAIFRGARHSVKSLKRSYLNCHGEVSQIGDRAALEHYNLLHVGSDFMLGGTQGGATPASLQQQETEDDVIVTNNVYDPETLPVLGSQEDMLLGTEDIYRSLTADGAAGVVIGVADTGTVDAMSALAFAASEGSAESLKLVSVRVKENTGVTVIPQLASLASIPTVRVEPSWKEIAMHMREVYSQYAKGGITLVYPTRTVTRGQRTLSLSNGGNSLASLSVVGMGEGGALYSDDEYMSGAESEMELGENEDAAVSMSGEFESTNASGTKRRRLQPKIASVSASGPSSVLTTTDARQISAAYMRTLVRNGQLCVSRCPLPEQLIASNATLSTSATTTTTTTAAASTSSTESTTESAATSSGANDMDMDVEPTKNEGAVDVDDFGAPVVPIAFKKERALHYTLLAARWMKVVSPMDMFLDNRSKTSKGLSKSQSLRDVRRQIQLNTSAMSVGHGSEERGNNEQDREGDGEEGEEDEEEDDEDMLLPNTPENIARANALLQTAITATTEKIRVLQEEVIPNLASCTTRQVFYGPECKVIPAPTKESEPESAIATTTTATATAIEREIKENNESEADGTGDDAGKVSGVESGGAVSMLIDESPSSSSSSSLSSLSVGIDDVETASAVVVEMDPVATVIPDAAKAAQEKAAHDAANATAAIIAAQTAQVYSECIVHCKKVNFHVDIFHREAPTRAGRMAVLRLQLERIEAKTKELKDHIASDSAVPIGTYTASNDMINAHVASWNNLFGGGLRKKEKPTLLEEPQSTKNTIKGERVKNHSSESAAMALLSGVPVADDKYVAKAASEGTVAAVACVTAVAAVADGGKENGTEPKLKCSGISEKMQTAMERIEVVFGYRIPCLHSEETRPARSWDSSESSTSSAIGVGDTEDRGVTAGDADAAADDADTGVCADAGAGVDADADADVDASVCADAGVGVDADVDADVDASVCVDADADADAGVCADADAGVCVDADAGTGTGAGAGADAGVDGTVGMELGGKAAGVKRKVNKAQAGGSTAKKPKKGATDASTTESVHVHPDGTNNTTTTTTATIIPSPATTTPAIAKEKKPRANKIDKTADKLEKKERKPRAPKVKSSKVTDLASAHAPGQPQQGQLLPSMYSPPANATSADMYTQQNIGHGQVQVGLARRLLNNNNNNMIPMNSMETVLKATGSPSEITGAVVPMDNVSGIAEE